MKILFHLYLIEYFVVDFIHKCHQKTYETIELRAFLHVGQQLLADIPLKSQHKQSLQSIHSKTPDIHHEFFRREYDRIVFY